MRSRPILAFAALAAFAMHAQAMPQQSASSAPAVEADVAAPAADAQPARERPRSIIAFRDAPAPDQDISKDNCLRFTGSRLMRDDRPNQRCAHAPGYVLMREDLDLAGAGSLADFVR